MSSVASPFGLRPAYHPSGYVRNEAGTITSAYGANIFSGSPVAIVADGSIQLAAAAARATGTFLGVEWTDTDGRRRVSNKWTTGTIGTAIVAYYTRDQNIIYVIQSSATLAQADVGSQANWTTNNTSSGNTTTGLSTVALDQATLTNSGNAGLRILGLSLDPDNAWGDTYVNVYVQIAQHLDVASQVAYA